VHLAGRGGCVLLLPGDRRPTRIDADLRAFPLAHARLARLGTEPGPPPLGALTGSAAVLWVSAGRGESAQLRELPVPTCYLVSPHPNSGYPVQFTVAGCSGQRIDLARSASPA
jgi:hypothetical protein